MKGIICAGGTGSRLYPLTEVTNKHLLGIYNKPMIFYPFETLLKMGIDEILIISSPDHSGAFQKLLGSGQRFGIDITYRIQESSGGIAEAIALGEKFANGMPIAVILGDNIFEDDFKKDVDSFKEGCCLFLKEVNDPERFGVVEIDENNNIISIEEKPKNPKTNLVQTGLYLYDKNVFNMIKTLKYSDRQELEIAELNNKYVHSGSAKAVFLKGDWTDAGTFESLFKANQVARNIFLAQ